MTDYLDAAALAPAIATHVVCGSDLDALATADGDLLAVLTAQAVWAVTIAHIDPEQRDALTAAVADRLARLTAATALQLTDDGGDA